MTEQTVKGRLSSDIARASIDPRILAIKKGIDLRPEIVAEVLDEVLNELRDNKKYINSSEDETTKIKVSVKTVRTLVNLSLAHFAGRIAPTDAEGALMMVEAMAEGFDTLEEMMKEADDA